MAKIMRIILFVLLLIGGVGSNLAAPEIRSVYTSQVGVREQPEGSNWGPQVSKYLKAVHLTKPEPWCAAFVAWCLDSAQIKNKMTGASGSGFNKSNLVYYNSQLLKAVEPGDVFTIYYLTLRRIGHTGFADQEHNGIVTTIEGNSNNGGSREGVGVFRRFRSIHTLYAISRFK